MKNISLKNTKFQTFLEHAKFIYQLFFGILPEIESPKPYVFVSPALARRHAVERAAARFELKKQGGAAR